MIRIFLTLFIFLFAESALSASAWVRETYASYYRALKYPTCDISYVVDSLNSAWSTKSGYCEGLANSFSPARAWRMQKAEAVTGDCGSRSGNRYWCETNPDPCDDPLVWNQETQSCQEDPEDPFTCQPGTIPGPVDGTCVPESCPNGRNAETGACIECQSPFVINPLTNQCQQPCVGGSANIFEFDSGSKPNCVYGCSVMLTSAMNTPSGAIGEFVSTGQHCDDVTETPPPVEECAQCSIDKTKTCPDGYLYATFGETSKCWPALDTNTIESIDTPPPGSTSETSSTTVTNPDGSTTTTTTTTTSSGSGGGAGGGSGGGAGVVVTTTVVNTNPDGTSTTTTTQEGDTRTASGGGGCVTPPVCSGDAIDCQILYQNWRAACADSKKSLSGLSDCSQPFDCSGDAIQCGLAMNQRLLTCKEEVTATELNDLLTSENQAAGFVGLAELALAQEQAGRQFDEVVEVPAVSTSPGSFLGTDCPADIPLDMGVYGVLSFPLSSLSFCSLFVFVGYLIQVSATLAAARLNYNAIMSV